MSVPIGLACNYVLAATVQRSTRYMKPGTFYANLTEAALRADPVNLEKISRGFPTLAEAVTMFRQNPAACDRLAFDHYHFEGRPHAGDM